MDKVLAIELMSKGCCECLDKPFDDEELVKRIAGLLEEKGKGNVCQKEECKGQTHPQE